MKRNGEIAKHRNWFFSLKFHQNQNILFLNVPLGKIYDPMGPVFSIYLCSPENFCNTFILFFSVFSDKFLIKSSKTIVHLNRPHFFLSELIFFYFLRFEVLGIFKFNEKMNENATLNSNISKTTQYKERR